MQKNDIKIKQVCALFIAFLPLTKIITAPSVFALNCGEKLWQPLIILLSLDLILLLFLIYVCKKNGNKSFFNVLNEASPTLAKGVFFIYSIFFLLKAFIPIIEHKQLIEYSFYETLPLAPVFYPCFAIIFYLCIKGFKVLGRVSEFAVVFTLIGLGLIFFLSVFSTDFSALLPLIAGSNKSGPITALNALWWFNDAIYLLFFLGRFDLQKKSGLKIFASYLLPFCAVILFYCIFYGIFTYVSPAQNVALSEISIFSVSLVNVGRFDYVATFILCFSGVFSIAIPVVCSVKCLTASLGLNRSKIPAIIICLLLLLLTILFSAKYTAVLAFYTKYLTPLFLICGYIMPLLYLLGGKKDVQKV
ncbi:MAG: GerAB/ArcD/ProY family transporter [Clostridia bacterium]|nr:GerAB/ArcD/ProY family transporter [Clostridia bacterium]